jgi:hypothetical protein
VQARECEFRLASGRKCRAVANRNQPFCRHHAPAPAGPRPPRIPKEERYSSLARWRYLGAQLQTIPADQIAYTVWDLLQCLVDRGPNSTGHISDLTAGRFLRALLNRLGDVPFPNPELAPVPANPPALTSAPGSAPQPLLSASQLASFSPEMRALVEALDLPSLELPQP